MNGYSLSGLVAHGKELVALRLLTIADRGPYCATRLVLHPVMMCLRVAGVGLRAQVGSSPTTARGSLVMEAHHM